jgi:hypothetical protein
MTEFTSLLAQRPALAERYAAFLSSVQGHAAVPARLNELCRARIQQIHGITPAGLDEATLVQLAATDYSSFTSAEAAGLAIAEKISFQHHGITDDDVEQVRQEVGNDGCVALLTALSFYDVECRLQLTTEALNVD